MKKTLALLLTLCLMASLCACGGPSDEEVKAVREVFFEGTELTVTLGTNKSTGYEWDYTLYGTCIESSVNRSFKVTGSKGDAVGEVSIGFEGKNEGTAVIVFTTPNGWDGTGAGDGYTVSVTVAADGKIVSAVGNEGANAPTPTTEPATEPTVKTSLTVAELAEGTYTGTLSQVEYANSEETIITTLAPAELSVTIANGQLTLYSEATATAVAILQGVESPPSPAFSIILSGSLPLQQSGDTVIAEGGVPISGEGITVYHNDMVFDYWEVKERESGHEYTCSVSIAMADGVPVASVSVKGSASERTATVPLALVSGT